MVNRSLHLFAGPSLGALAPAQLNAANILLHPPAQRGDIQALVEANPCAIIAIADGLFHQQPAVGHAEIRDAIRGGAHVWGLCSMGAIRAAEMSHLGMRGFGEVFKAYCCDPGLPDDEVALLHYPQAPYVAISEPMIHWRGYLRALEGSGVLDQAASEDIQADLASRWYGERTLEYGADLLARLGGVYIEVAILDHELEPYRIKQRDLKQFVLSRPWDSTWPYSNSPIELLADVTVDLGELGGLPFIDMTFDSTRFLSSVAGRRLGLLGDSQVYPGGYAAMLEPERAVNVLTRRLAQTDFMPPHTELTVTEKQWAETALRRVRTCSSCLAVLFDLPIRVVRWNSTKVSMTNPFIPQTIFLGEGALQSTFAMMEEVWVHEYAHVWLGMLCELSDLQKRGSTQDYTLPSGTGPKDARGVLLAAHFAGAVVSYFLDSAEHVTLTGRRAERLHYVQWYLREALQIPIAKDLTPMGWAVFERLKQHSKLNVLGK